MSDGFEKYGCDKTLCKTIYDGYCPKCGKTTLEKSLEKEVEALKIEISKTGTYVSKEKYQNLHSLCARVVGGGASVEDLKEYLTKE